MFYLLLLFNIVCFSYATDLVQNTSVLKGKNNGGSTYISSRTNVIPFNRTFFDKSDNILRVPHTFYEDNKRKSKIKKTPKRTIQKIIKKNTVKRKRIYVNLATRLPTVSTVYDDSNVHSRQNDDTRTTETNLRRRPKKNSKVLRYHMPFQKLQSRYRRNKREARKYLFGRNQREHTQDLLRRNNRENTEDLLRRNKRENTEDLLRKNNRGANRDDDRLNERDKDVFRRMKRDADRNDIVILKDLDEMEFVENTNDYDIVRAHVQNYW